MIVLILFGSSCKKQDRECAFVDNVPDIIIADITLGGEYCAFSDTYIQFDAPLSSGATYSWNTGDTTSSITVIDGGTYTVQVITPSDSNEYSAQIVSCGSFFAPSSFTPDGDGINEIYIAMGQGIGCFFMEIQDDEGKTVFTSNDINTGWNGKLNNEGDVLPMGAYNSYIETIFAGDGSPHTYYGLVMLIR